MQAYKPKRYVAEGRYIVVGAGIASVNEWANALELPYEQFCFACFDGRYPEPVPYDVGERKLMLETVGA